MKKSQIILFLYFLICYSCKNNSQLVIKQELSLIDSTFLKILDTTIYKYNTLRPAPNDSTIQITTKSPVHVYERLVNLYTWDLEIKLLIKELKPKAHNEYLEILQLNSRDTISHSFDPTKLTKTGRFKLIKSNNAYSSRKEKMNSIGGLIFSRVLFNESENKAIIVATIRDNIKSGITRLYLLKKEKNSWKIDDTGIIEVW